MGKDEHSPGLCPVLPSDSRYTFRTWIESTRFRHSCSNGVLSGSKVVMTLLSTVSHLLLLKWGQASAVASGSLESQVLWCELALFVGFTSSGNSLFAQDSKTFGDTLSEDSDLGKVHLWLG